MAEPFLASQLVQEFCFDLNEKEPLIRIIKKNCTTRTFWQLDEEIKINKRTGRKGGSLHLLIKAALCRFSNSKWWFQNHFYHSLTCDGEEGTPAVAMAHSAGLKSRYIYIYITVVACQTPSCQNRPVISFSLFGASVILNIQSLVG